MKMFMSRALLALCAVLLWGAPTEAQEKQPEALTVFAASSLTNVLQDIGAAFTQSAGVPVKFSFAASSALARQIEAGAAADVFFSADVEWMDYLQARSLIQVATRADIIGNRLVLIAPQNSAIALKIAPGFQLVEALGAGGRLATGEVNSVPVGRYAKAALTRLGVWNAVAPRIVGAENVRAALAFVDRGEAPLGIVYESDARVDKRVRIVDIFPADSHPRITYPVAVVRGGKTDAQRFVSFLRSETAQRLFQAYGFAPLK